jgi:hypothetical protein
MKQMKELLCFMALGIASMKAQTDLTNKRVFENACQAVWSPAVRVMIENDFRPTVMDKDSSIATFSFEKVLDGTDADKFVLIPKYMGAKGSYTQRSLMDGHPMRLESASLVFVEQSGKCSVAVKTAGYAVFISRSAGWEPLESNFAFETRLLDAVGVQLKQ